ncbi:hypothetical protein [Nostoc sp.]|uniref:hypothetical protein n=1 Tax=Nostoc sp. TaxID=1180 RepID=UPI002FF78577
MAPHARHRLTPLDASPLKSGNPPMRLAPLFGETPDVRGLAYDARTLTPTQ